jgi:DNA excision repair protein ERCC-4
VTACPRVLVDTREQAPLRFSNRVDLKRVTLGAGDYGVATCTEQVRLERNSLENLVACVSWERERFLEHCQHLAAYPVQALVVEAALADVFTERCRARVRPSCIIGTCTALVVDCSLPVL